MPKLDYLIEKLCPNGVEFEPLWSLTAWDKRFNGIDKDKQKKVISYKYYLSTDFDKVEREKGDIKYISTGISGKDRYTTEELAKDYIAEGEIVCIPWGGTPNIKYHKGKFVTGDNRIATSLDTNTLDNKFLYYWMQSNIGIISTFYRGAGIKHPSMKDVLDMRIPVPPLEVQCEIVHILDDFTLLSAELSAELKARQKQYEYYKSKIFKNVIKEGTEYRKLNEIADVRDGTHDSPKPVLSGKYLVTSKNVKNGGINFEGSYFISEEDFNFINQRSKVDKGDLLFTMIGTIGEVGLVKDEPDYAIKNVGLIKTNNELLSKFLFYYLTTREVKEYIENNKSRGSQVFLALGKLRNLPVPILNDEKKEYIVNTLDRFNKLCNDIFEGLPAEIEARQKQYEYYIDKLLTFKELKNEG